MTRTLIVACVLSHPGIRTTRLSRSETVEKDGAKVRVMAGDSHGLTGPIAMRNPGLLLDVVLEKGATFSTEVCGILQLLSPCLPNCTRGV